MAGELSTHFPSRFGGAEQEALAYYRQQQRRVLALCDYVATGSAKHLATIAAIDTWLLDLAPPEIFDDGAEGNVLTRQRRRFGQLCAALADQGFPRAFELTLFDFHAAVDHLVEKHKSD